MEIRFKDKLYLSVIFLVGVILRFTWILWVKCNPVSDFETYQQIAINIFMNKGHSYLGQSVAFQGMGYPIALGWFYKLIGSNDIFYGKLFNVIMSSLTMVFILAILIKLVNNKKVIYLVFAVVAILPNYIAYNNVLGTESLATLLFVMVIFLQISKLNNLIKFIFMGAIIGLLALVKPNFLVYPIVLAVIEWMKSKKLKDVGKLFICSVTSMCIIVAPWAYRNYKKFKLFIPVSYNGGYVLFINNNSNNTNGAWMPIGKVRVSENVKKNMLNCGLSYGSSMGIESKQVIFNPELEGVLKNEAEKWILTHPGEFCRLGFKRVNNTFFKGAGDIQEWAMHGSDNNVGYIRLLKGYYIRSLLDNFIKLISTTGIIYLILNIKNIILSIFTVHKKIDYKVSIPVINTAFFLVISFVFEGQPRYNYPILFLLVFSSLQLIFDFKEKYYSKIKQVFIRIQQS